MPSTANDFNRYEKAVIRLDGVSKELGLAVGETSRRLRLANPSQGPQAKTIWETGVDVAGPAFVLFTWWVLQQARSRNARRLYFLARDGLIFRKIAQLLDRDLPLSLDCRYLYGSRHLWLISSLKRIDQSALDWILSDWWYELTIHTACKRLGINPLDIEDLLARHGWDESSWEKRFSSTEKKRFEKFLKNAHVQEKILILLRSTFENTLGYLKQEGVGEEEDLFLVDIGWRGKPQAALNQILAKGGIRPRRGIKGLYFGLTEGQEISGGDQISGFLFDLSKSLDRCQIRNNHIYEAFASAPEPKISHFVKKNEEFLPVFQPETNALRAWGVELQQESILAFAKEFAGHYDFKTFRLEEGYRILDKTLQMFLDNPSQEEAETYGRFPMDGEMTESQVQEIAPVVTRKKFWYLCGHLKRFNLFWVQASLARSNLSFEKRLWRLILPLFEYGFYSCVILGNKLYGLLGRRGDGRE